MPIRNINILTHVVEEIRSLKQQLRHPSIVIFFSRDVAVSTLLSLFAAHGVRNVWAEGLSAKAFTGDGLLSVVEPIAILVLRTDYHGACRADRRYLVPCNGSIDTEHVSVVT